MARTGRPKKFATDLHIRVEPELEAKIQQLMAQMHVNRSEAARTLIDMGIKYDAEHADD
jgi:hypothetical protein